MVEQKSKDLDLAGIPKDIQILGVLEHLEIKQPDHFSP